MQYLYTLSFLIFVPAFVSCLFSTRTKLSNDILWLFGLLLISLIIILFHGHGINKNITFGFIFTLSFLGFISYINKLESISLISNIFTFKFFVYFIISFFLLEIGGKIYFEPLVAGDSLAYWWSKTKALYYWEPLELFKTPSYPHLGSTIWMLAISFTDVNEYLGRIFFTLLQAIIFVSFCFSFYQKEVDFFKDEINFLNKLIYSIFIIILFKYMVDLEFADTFSFTYSGYMDWFLAILPCFSFFLLIKKNIFQNKSNFYKLDIENIVLIVFLSCTALIKAEGYVAIIIYLISIIIIDFFYERKIFNKKNIFSIFITFVLIIFITYLNTYVYFINDIYLENSQKFDLNNPNILYLNILDRSPLIFEFFYKSILYFSPIYCFYISTIIIMFFLKHYFFIYASILPIVLFNLFIYLVFISTTNGIHEPNSATGIAHFEWHLNTAHLRLSYHIAIIMVFSSIINIRFILKEKIFSR